MLITGIGECLDDTVRRDAMLNAFLFFSHYTREEAAYPLRVLRQRKFWPSVSRVDDAHGDRTLICECGTIDEYSVQTPT